MLRVHIRQQPQVMRELLFLEDSFHINELPAKYIPMIRKGNVQNMTRMTRTKHDHGGSGQAPRPFDLPTSINSQILSDISASVPRVDSNSFRACKHFSTRPTQGVSAARTKARLVTVGRKEARSEGAGKGSEFVVRIPELRVATVKTPVAPTRSPAPRARLRLLLVDDNVDSARTLAMLLELSGHEVHVVHDGAAALAAVAKDAVDCVLLDIGMPEMSGYEVAQRLRGERTFTGTLIALTGYGRDYDRAQVLSAGFDNHLVKPVDYAVLEDLLEKVASSKLTNEGEGWNSR